MGINTAAGSKFYIGTTATNPVGDTYQEVGFVESIGEFGRVYDEVTFTSLGDRNVLKFKGQRNDGSIALQLGRDLTDDGQEDMKAALDSDLDYNFKVELNDDSETTGATPTNFVFKAKVMSFTTNVGGPNQVVGANVALGIKSGSITETAAT